MPKVTLKQILTEYSKNQSFIKSDKRDTIQDVQELIKAKEKAKALSKNIVKGVVKALGNEKLGEVVKKIYDIKAKKDNKFNPENEFKSLNERLDTLRSRAIVDEMTNPNSLMPNREEIKNFANSKKIYNTTHLGRYGIDKFYKEVLNEFKDPLKNYIEEKKDIRNVLVVDKIADELEEALNDPALGIDLNTEVDKDDFVFESKDPLFTRLDDKKETISELEKTNAFKNYDKSDLTDLEYVISKNNMATSNPIVDLRDSLERETNKRVKAELQNSYEEDLDKYYNVEILQNEKNHPYPVRVPKPGHEKEAKEYEENIEFKLSKEVKEGLKLGLSKLSSMNLKRIGAEEGTKQYAFSKIYESIFKIKNITTEFENIVASIKAKEAELNAIEDENKKEEIRKDLDNLNKDKEAKALAIIDAKNEYNAEKANMDELFAICKKYFANTKLLNTNVDISRTAVMPVEYRMDPIVTNQINGLLYVLTMIKDANSTIDEFLENPGKIYSNYIQNKLRKKDILINGKEKTLYDQYRKIVNYTGYSKEHNSDIDNVGIGVRGFEFLSTLDDEFLIHNKIAANNVDMLAKRLSNHGSITRVLGDNSLETYQRLFTVDDVPIMDLVADEYFDPIADKIIKPKPFDLDNYINTHKISPISLLGKYEQMAKAIIDKNEPASKSRTEVSDEEISKDLLKASEGLGIAAIKLMQKEGIDPETCTDPFYKELINSIENPIQFIKDYIGFKNCNVFNGYSNKPIKDKLNMLKESKLDIDGARLKLNDYERKALDEEKDFDQMISFKRQAIDIEAERRFSKANPSAEDYEVIAKEESKLNKLLSDHCNQLKKQVENGTMPEGFYRLRIEQVMALAPLGDLKYFGNKLNISEREFVEAKKEENVQARDAKAEYNRLVQKIDNEENIMLKNIAKKSSIPYKGIKQYEEAKDTIVGVNISTIEEKENRAFDEKNIINVNTGQDQEIDINSIIKNEDDLEKRLDEISNPKRTKISVDLNEKKLSQKSNFKGDENIVSVKSDLTK